MNERVEEDRVKELKMRRMNGVKERKGERAEESKMNGLRKAR